MIDTATVYGTEKGVGIGVQRAIDEGLVTRGDLFIMTKLPPYDQSVDKVSLWLVIVTSFKFEFEVHTSVPDG